MCRAEIFILFFLLGLKNLVNTKRSCHLENFQQLCVCSLQDLLEKLETQTFLTCISATGYELRGGNLSGFESFSNTEPTPEIIEILDSLPVTKLIFTDLVVPENLLVRALSFVSYTTQVSTLEFINCTFLRADLTADRDQLNLKVSSLLFHKVTADPLDDRLLEKSHLGGWLQDLENLTISESNVTSIPCKIGMVFTALHLLDVSGNHFQEWSVKSSFCEGAFPRLQVLKLNHNHLTSYGTVCSTLAHLSMLTHLDLSQNNFLPEMSSSPCTWPQSLHILNLSSTGFKYMDKSLPPNIEILDLSANSIFTLDLWSPSLKELYLSNNMLQTIPSVKGLPKLEVLSLDQNQISQLPRESLQHLKHLRGLKAGLNPYNCSCRQYIREIQKLANQRFMLPDWPHDYICRTPPEYEDNLLDEVPLSSLQCDKALVSHGSLVCLLTCLLLVSSTAIFQT